MRTLEKNKRPLYVANPTGEVIHPRNEDGYETGGEEPVYTEPVRMKFNISAAVGQAEAEAFGAFTDYSRTIVTTGKTPLIEGSRIWYGVPPTGKHNYVVVRAADSVNGKLFALKEVV